MRQKGFAHPVIIILGIVLLLGIIGGVYFWGTRKNVIVPITPKACTQEAKICPDGSSVGRTGPNCEFSPCPTVKPTISKTADETGNWKIYINNELGYQFKYPGDWVVDTNKSKPFTAKYLVGGVEWSLVVDFTTNEQLGLMGITYCGAHPEDKARCEGFKINDSVVAGIDWGASSDDSANATISYPKGGAISFHLTPVLSESKQIFNQILSTFKFNQ